MGKKSNNETDLVITARLAAQYLAGHLGESQEIWQYRLANWRRPGRASPLPHQVAPAGTPAYLMTDVEAYAKRKMAAAAATNLTEGDQVRCSAAAKTDGNVAPHVRVSFAIGSVHQVVYAIDAESATRLASMLTGAVKELAQAAKAKVA